MVNGFVPVIFGNVVINRNHARDAVSTIILQENDSQITFEYKFTFGNLFA